MRATPGPGSRVPRYRQSKIQAVYQKTPIKSRNQMPAATHREKGSPLGPASVMFERSANELYPLWQKRSGQLLLELAEKVGGEHPARMRAALRKKTPFDNVSDQPISDDEFAWQMKGLERDFRNAVAKMKRRNGASQGCRGDF